MTIAACHLPGLFCDRSCQHIPDWRFDFVQWMDFTYQTFEPYPQIGKSCEASVKRVPLILSLWDWGNFELASEFSRYRCPSNSWAAGYFSSFCIISQADTQAISPTAIWGPPLENLNGSSAFLRMATSKFLVINASYSSQHSLLSRGFSRTVSLIKLSRSGSVLIFV